MYLKFIEEGTLFNISEEAQNSKSAFTCEAFFHRLNTDTSFFAKGEALYQNAQRLGAGVRLTVNFFRGPNMYTFTGAAKGVKLDNGIALTLIEQVSGIEATSRREYDRTEMRRDIYVYGLAEDDLNSGNLRKASHRAEFVSDMFDISAGGLCMVSNEYLNSSYEPYFLLEFSLTAKDNFLLPAKLLRKGSCPQTTLYRYDYGFEFNFTHIPQEKDRLIMAIFNAKLTAFGRW